MAYFEAYVTLSYIYPALGDPEASGIEKEFLTTKNDDDKPPDA